MYTIFFVKSQHALPFVGRCFCSLIDTVWIIWSLLQSSLCQKVWPSVLHLLGEWISSDPWQCGYPGAIGVLLSFSVFRSGISSGSHGLSVQEPKTAVPPCYLIWRGQMCDQFFVYVSRTEYKYYMKALWMSYYIVLKYTVPQCNYIIKSTILIVEFYVCPK